MFRGRRVVSLLFAPHTSGGLSDCIHGNWSLSVCLYDDNIIFSWKSHKLQLYPEDTKGPPRFFPRRSMYGGSYQHKYIVKSRVCSWNLVSRDFVFIVPFKNEGAEWVYVWAGLSKNGLFDFFSSRSGSTRIGLAVGIRSVP